MSLSRTSSAKQLLTQSQQPPNHQQTTSAEQEKDHPATQTGSKEKQSSASRESGKKKPSSPPLKPPIVRRKLVARERSISSPQIARPIPADNNSTTNQTTDEKNQAPSSTTPKVRTRKPNPARKSLTPEAQLASDLADLFDKHLLRKQSKADAEIIVSQMTTNLQRYTGKPADAKVRLDELMLKMFAEEMKQSEAWDIAGQLMVKIRSTYFRGRDEASALNENEQKEMMGVLELLTASFAGAFFNVSGTHEHQRLPGKLRYFLQAVDHRQIRILLSNQAGQGMSHQAFMEARKNSLATALIDAFLMPLILKEFCLSSGTMESNTTANCIAKSLHAALSVSAPMLLAESLQSPPDDIADLMLKRRAPQLQSNKQHPQSTSSLMTKTTSPGRQRRTELKQLLEKIIRKLIPGQFSTEMLAEIRSYNNEFALSAERIQYDKLLTAWLLIAKKIDPKASLIANLQQLIDEEIEQSFLSKELVEADLLAKLAAIETSRLPHVTAPVSTASISQTPISSSTTLLSTPQATHIETRRRSPVSPSARPARHHRSKTADVMLPAEKTELSELTPKQHAAMIKAYPDLLLASVINEAMIKDHLGEKIKNDPINAIWTAGRNKFSIPLETIPVAVRVKILPWKKDKTKDKTISHTALLKLLINEKLRLSNAGKTINTRRSEALLQAGNSLTVEQLTKERDHIGEKKLLNDKFQPMADALVEEIFGNGFQAAGLPAELIDICKSFDKKLTTWIYQVLKSKIPTITDTSINALRSNLLFDLVVTRTLYPLVMGTDLAQDSVNATNFASAFRKAIDKLWVSKLFDEFKALQDADATSNLSVTGSASTSQTPGVSPEKI